MSTNGVDPERPELSACDVAHKATLTDLRRGQNGYWNADLTVVVTATLPDGREIHCSGMVRVWGKQRGRKRRAK